MQKVVAILCLIGIGVSSLSAQASSAHELAPQAAPYDDEFNSTTLNSRWSWDHENPAKWNLSANPGSMRLFTTQGDMFQTVNAQSNVLLQDAPSGDFLTETKVAVVPVTRTQQADLILWDDQDNHLRCAMQVGSGNSSTGTYAGFFVESQAKFVDYSFQAWPSTAMTYMRLKRVGQTYQCLISSDGQAWTLVGTHSLGSNILQGKKIGIFATAGTNNPGAAEIPADFDYFHLQTLSRVYLPISQRADEPALFSDDFSNNDNQWLTFNNATGSLTVSGGEYVWTLPVADRYHQIINPASPMVDRYAVEVDARKSQLNNCYYGVLFGFKDASHLYRLWLLGGSNSNAGYFLIDRVDGAAITTLKTFTFNPLFDSGQTSHRIRIERVGAAIRAFVDGTLIATLSDSTYTGPTQSGLFVQNPTGSTAACEVRFDNFAIRAVAVN